jgi:hypothetical protein
MELSLVLCKQGVTGSIPVTSTNIFNLPDGAAPYAVMLSCDRTPVNEQERLRSNAQTGQLQY